MRQFRTPSAPTPQNPCVRKCCLDTDETCLGCGRRLDEILNWHRLSDTERRLILERKPSR